MTLKVKVAAAARVAENLEIICRRVELIYSSMPSTNVAHNSAEKKLIQEKIDAFTKTEIYQKSEQIEKLAKEALALIEPTVLK